MARVMLSLLIATAATPQLDQGCQVLVQPKAAGEAVFAEDAALASCPKIPPSGMLRYDKHRGLVVARSDIAAGSELGRVWLPRRPAVAAGDQVSIVAKVGHTSITRGAVALQSAEGGQRFFVRTADGVIFVAPAMSRSGDGR